MSRVIRGLLTKLMLISQSKSCHGLGNARKRYHVIYESRSIFPLLRMTAIIEFSQILHSLFWTTLSDFGCQTDYFFTLLSYFTMSYQRNIHYCEGQALTGRLWRNRYSSFFKLLPFYSDIPRMDEMSGPIQHALVEGRGGSRTAFFVVS